ncbi:hypothetical protein CFOL_v3_26419 [Cephalotus follicularis]|uniref:Uncharacterized protein n=1 Tax=Cephalotus follicularis TaxID=3775 RepID=A0A1Q3CSF4_CEPFO|nr:hypothetical protein CFOL_v3_26419 [Cephalotus follicularis]
MKKENELFISMRLSMSLKDKDGVHYGITSTDLFSKEVSLILFGDIESAAENGIILLSYINNHGNILHFENIVDQYVVRACPFDFLFRTRLEEFLKDKSSELSDGDKKASWWKYIEKDVILIFRGVVRVMMFLYDWGTHFGNVEHGIYVTFDGINGRL